MEGAFRAQELLIDELERLKKSFVAKERKTMSYLKRLSSNIDEMWNTFMETHSTIIKELRGTKEEIETPYFKQYKYGSFRETVMDFQSEIEELLIQSKAPEVQECSTASRESEIKLPRIELPQFSGDYGDWCSFRDLFSSLILKKESLSKVEKLHYLKCSLKGEPANLLCSYKVTEQNLDTAWKTLVDRYDNKAVLLTNQFRKLLRTEPVSETATSLKGILDSTMESVQIIEGLGVKNLWHSMVVFHTVQRLPAATRVLWEQEQAVKKDVLLLPDLKTFLTTRFRTLEATTFSCKSNNSIKRIHTHHVESRFECCICKQQHKLRNCPKFISMGQSQRYDVVKKHQLCLNSLGKGHISSKCGSSIKCMKCNMAHHTMLHKDVNTPAPTVSFPSTSSAPFIPNSINSLNSQLLNDVLLPTAMVNVCGNNGVVTLRALLDQGSQGSFITEHAVQLAGLKKGNCDYVVSGIGNSKTMRSKGLVKARVEMLNSEEILVEAIVLSKLTSNLPTRHIQPIQHPSLLGIQLADVNYNKPARVDMVIGADTYGKLLLNDTRLLPNGILLQHTKLGWVLSGKTDGSKGGVIKSFIVRKNENEEISQQLRKFWELEEPKVEVPMMVEDALCEEYYKQTTTREESGRYVVRLPFKNDPNRDHLGGSRRAAEASLKALERKFDRDANLYKEYSSCMEDLLKKNYMSPVKRIDELTTNFGETRCQAHYLPHHAVCKESSTTKTRVVFDASRRTTSGLSLNDVLLTGSSMQNEMIAVVIRWRIYYYAFVADIEKMFLQIKVHPDDTDFQRLLWRFHPDDCVSEYRLNRVIFGLTSAPFLAIRTLKQLAEDGKSAFPIAAKIVNENFYVDDVLSGGHTLKEAKGKIGELITLLKSGGFHLRKWVSNEESLLKDIPMEDIEMKNVQDINLDEGHKSLGMLWYPKGDYITYRYNMMESSDKLTKRVILSDIARLYDPMGWICPIIIKPKCLMQQLWLHGTNWDQEVPKNLREKWEEFRNDISLIEKIKLPRCVVIQNFTDVSIHGFCDASEYAYGAALYCITRGSTGIQSRIIMAKAKVAPIRPVTIPRLELCGALLLAKILKQFINSVGEQVNVRHIQLWTDSKIVLSWLRGHPSRWTIFVANRVCQIMDLAPDISWRHVPSELNPADIASRGSCPEYLKNFELWWNGPKFLLLPEEQWPDKPEVEATTEEVSIKRVVCHYIHTKRSELEVILSKFSSITRLIRVTAYCRRFINVCLKRMSNASHLTTVELNEALTFWIIYVQDIEFEAEITLLKVGKPINKSSKILKFNPFLDGNGVLRIGGRLAYANMNFEEKHPVILPKTGKLTQLLIRKCHQDTLHGEVQLVLASLRRKYWILDARNSVKKCIHNCIICFRQKAKTSSQLMGTLPSPRVNISRPFTHVGVDYCGPINIKDRKGRGGRIFKGYIAIFICLAVKAIHIEVVNDMTTEAFIGAFKRFVSRRGLCSDVYSDCGSNFIGANAELARIAQSNRRIAEDVTNQGITWHFSPPGSPHFGGLWEAGVKSMKLHLKKTLGNTSLTYEEMCTTVAQIEACLNSRPLCPLSDDHTDASALTPGHFLIGDAMLSVPENNLLDVKLNYLSRWQLTQRLTQGFWLRWSDEYISRLQHRPKWLSREPNPQIGDLCLLKDERLSSCKWPLARITELHPGKDSLVRVVSVIRNGNTFQRNITKIALLPIAK